MPLKRSITAVLCAKPLKDVTVGYILGGLLVSCLVTIGVLDWLAFAHRTHAEAFLSEFADLKLEKSSFADAQQIAQRYKGFPWYVTPTAMTCTFQRCRFAFQFDNMPLSYVPSVGYTRLFALISIRDGIVDGREVDYERASRVGGYFCYVIFDSQGPLPKGWAYGVLRLRIDSRDSRGVPHVLQVNLGPQSSDELRERAYSVNLSCLAKLYGCGGPAIYPSGLNYLGPSTQGVVPGEQ